MNASIICSIASTNAIDELNEIYINDKKYYQEPCNISDDSI